MVNRESERKRLVELLDNSFKEELGMNLNKPFLDGFAERILADGWMRPPVKLGQTVYILAKISQIIVEAKVIGVWTYVDRCNIITDQGILLLNAIGKTVFTSREDAEKALKGEGE